MGRGDHIRVRRWGGAYWHHGIDLGNGEVIHYSADRKNAAEATVRKDRLDVFTCNADFELVPYDQRLTPDETVRRAESRLGERRYDPIHNNCEHFARWSATGLDGSEQVTDRASFVGYVGGAAAVKPAVTGTVSALGTVAGLSGPGIMSGLGTAGSLVGGGPAAGVAVLAAGPAALSVAAMHAVLKDDEALPSAEREARRAGRVASIAGAGVGLAGGIAAISASGSVAGLSAAGITSGLAAIGGTVGGGMLAGTALTAAAPALAAAAIGYGAYRLCRRLLSSARSPAAPKRSESR